MTLSSAPDASTIETTIQALTTLAGSDRVTTSNEGLNTTTINIRGIDETTRLQLETTFSTLNTDIIRIAGMQHVAICMTTKTKVVLDGSSPLVNRRPIVAIAKQS